MRTVSISLAAFTVALASAGTARAQLGQLYRQPPSAQSIYQLQATMQATSVQLSQLQAQYVALAQQAQAMRLQLQMPMPPVNRVLLMRAWRYTDGALRGCQNNIRRCVSYLQISAPRLATMKLQYYQYYGRLP